MKGSDQAQPAKLPRTLQYARIVIGIQIFRLIALSFIPLLQNGSIPATFAIPATTGDVLTAITAPIVAYGLGRGGVKTWAAALVWNALGLADLINAIGLGYLTGASTYLINNDLPLFFAVGLAIALHIAAAALLLTKQTMNRILRA